MRGSPGEVQPVEEVLTQCGEEAAPAPRTPPAKRGRPAAPKTPPKTKAGFYDASNLRVSINLSTGMSEREHHPQHCMPIYLSTAAAAAPQRLQCHDSLIEGTVSVFRAVPTQLRSCWRLTRSWKRLLQPQRMLLPHRSAGVASPLKMQQSPARQPSAAGESSARVHLLSHGPEICCSMFGTFNPRGECRQTAVGVICRGPQLSLVQTDCLLLVELAVIML